MNQGLSIGAINKAIKTIEKSGSLKAIRLKVDVDQNVMKALKEFNQNINLVNSSIKAQRDINKSVADSTKKSSEAIKQETEALKEQNEAMHKNNVLKTRTTKIRNESGGTDVQTQTTVGDKHSSTTTMGRIQQYDAKGNHIGEIEDASNKKIVETFDYAKLRESEKALQRFTDNSNARLKELRKVIGNLNPEITKLSKEIKKLEVDSSKQDMSRIEDQIKSLEKYTTSVKKQREDDQKLADQIADGRIKAQERFEKLEEERQKKIIDRAHREALEQEKLVNQMADFREQSQKRVQNDERKRNETQQKHIQENAELQRKEDTVNAEARKQYSDWWNEALRKQEISRQNEIEKLERARIQDTDRAEYDAYKEKEARERNLHGKRIQDQKVAYELARKEDDAFNIRRMDNIHKIALQENKEFNQRIANEQKFALKQQDALNKLAIARQKFGHHKSVSVELDAIEARIRDTDNLNAKTKNWENSLKQVNTEIAKSTAGFKAMRVEAVGFIDGFKTAMVKFPIWMAAATAIYAPLRGLQAAIDTIIQLDAQVVELKRVMDQETNFENMLQGSIDLSKELGRSITEVNQALIGFARQGFNESEILDLTKSATLATNISELNADEAMDAITAAMVVFNIEADKSLSIIDAINETDNNFAVTSKNLAIGMQKSASAASTFGVSMYELLGDLTGIMQVTRESGSVAGKQKIAA